MRQSNSLLQFYLIIIFIIILGVIIIQQLHELDHVHSFAIN